MSVPQSGAWAPDAVGPRTDADSEPFWAGLREHRVLLQRCASCDRVRFPPTPGCPSCGATTSHPFEPAGTGNVYSWVRVHRTADERFFDDVPYSIVAVDLDEGCRMFGRLEPPMAPSVGTRVRIHLVDHATWTELGFRGEGGLEADR